MAPFSEHEKGADAGPASPSPAAVPRTGPSMTVLLSVQGLTKGYGPRPLFSDLSLDLRAGERVGLIGPNGSGKSTLLRLLAGREEADAGVRSLRRTARLGYLAQDDVFAAGQTVRDVLLAALAADHLEDHERETRAAITLTQVGFADPDQPADVLSGGWRKRLSLARELVRRPDLLLLDEPTNHLDLPGIVWLERLLRAAPFGYVVATHDRAFLRAVADEIIEISRVYPGGYFRSAGSYDEFVEQREEFLEAQARREESVANQVRRETEWLGRKAAAQRSKVVVPHRGRRPAARGTGRIEIPQRRDRSRRHRLRRHRPADAQAAHRRRHRQVARRPKAVRRPRPGPHARRQARPARPQRQRQEHPAARAGRGNRRPTPGR